MRRMIGKYAQERAEIDSSNISMRKLALSLSSSEIPPLDAADNLISLCMKGLQEDRIRADGVAKRFDDFAGQILDSYGEISTGA